MPVRQGRTSGGKAVRITIACTVERKRLAERLAKRLGMDTSHLFETRSFRTIVRQARQSAR